MAVDVYRDCAVYLKHGACVCSTGYPSSCTAPSFLTSEEADRLFGSDRDVQCGRCGSTLDFEDCDACCGEGVNVWEDDEGCEIEEECEQCGGDGFWSSCLSSDEWCQTHPLPGREGTDRGEIEWFEVPL